MSALEQLKAFARYQTHAGYRWAAVMADGECMCEKCVLANYRQVYSATRKQERNCDWTVIGLTNSGESESSEQCVHCGTTLWDVLV